MKSIDVQDPFVASQAHLWCHSDRIIFSDIPVEPGAWMEVVSLWDSLMPVAYWAPWLLAGGKGVGEARSRYWALRAIGWGPVPLENEPERAHAVVFAAPENSIGVSTLWHWHRRGTQEFWFHEWNGWRRLDARAHLARRLSQRVIRRTLGRLPKPLTLNHESAQALIVKCALAWHGPELPEVLVSGESEASCAFWERCIEKDNRTLSSSNLPGAGKRLRVTHYTRANHGQAIGDQVVALAAKLVGHDYPVEVLTLGPANGEQGAAMSKLAACDVPVRQACVAGLTARASQELDWDLIQTLPAPVREPAVHLAAELLMNWPDVLHCWDEEANLIGAAAGIMAGVPRILVSPSSGLAAEQQPYVPVWLEILLRSERVRLVDGSVQEHAGEHALSIYHNLFSNRPTVGQRRGAA